MTNEDNSHRRTSTPGEACSHRDTLFTYLDNDCSRAERRAFEVHLSGCDTCQDELASFTTLERAFQDETVKAALRDDIDALPKTPVGPSTDASLAPVSTFGWWDTMQARLRDLLRMNLEPAWVFAVTTVLVLTAGGAGFQLGQGELTESSRLPVTLSDSQNPGEQLEEPEPTTASRPAPSPPRTMVLRGGPSQAVVEGVSSSTRERLEQLLEFIEQSDHPNREMLVGALLALAQELDIDLTVHDTP